VNLITTLPKAGEFHTSKDANACALRPPQQYPNLTISIPESPPPDFGDWLDLSIPGDECPLYQYGYEQPVIDGWIELTNPVRDPSKLREKKGENGHDGCSQL